MVQVASTMMMRLRARMMVLDGFEGMMGFRARVLVLDDVEDLQRLSFK